MIWTLSWSIMLPGNVNFYLILELAELNKFHYGGDILEFSCKGLLTEHIADNDKQVIFVSDSVPTNRIRRIRNSDIVARNSKYWAGSPDYGKIKL